MLMFVQLVGKFYLKVRLSSRGISLSILRYSHFVKVRRGRRINSPGTAQPQETPGTTEPTLDKLYEFALTLRKSCNRAHWGPVGGWSMDSDAPENGGLWVGVLEV